MSGTDIVPTSNSFRDEFPIPLSVARGRECRGGRLMRSTPVSAAVLLAGGVSAISAQTRAADPVPLDPVETIIRAFEHKPIVAMAEAHSLEEEHDLIVRLIREPRFVDAASTIVVEWANALYQDSIDRYVAGEDEPKARVARAWRNTGFSPLAPWDAPVYAHFFDVVRDVNLKRAVDRRIRVVAADPPIDWNATRQEIEATKQRYPRDAHFFSVIDREVLAPNRKALLIFGGGHLYRHWWNPFATGPTPPNLIDLLEQKARGSVFVIMVHAFVERDAELESRFKQWKAPAMAQLSGTWLGLRSTDPLMQISAERGFPDGTVARAKVNAYVGLKLQDLADAYLYLGDMESLTASVPTPAFFTANPDYVEELRRRFRLINGGELPDSYFSQVRSPKYYKGKAPTP